MKKHFRRPRFNRLHVLVAIWVGAWNICATAETVCVVTDRDPGPGAMHGLAKFRQAVETAGSEYAQVTSWSKIEGDLCIVAGLAGAGQSATAIHKDLSIAEPSWPQSLLIRYVRYQGRKVLLVSGADDHGLMYALLDIADRIGWTGAGDSLLKYVRDTEESPDVPERALSMYTMHQGRFESFVYDEQYWVAYLDMLAKNRFNTFALLFGYENWGYFSPPYPYFFDTEGFEDVRVVGITKEKQQRNLNALNRIIRMTHERGMDFTLGIWDHIYRSGVQGPSERAKRPTEGIVWGLTQDNLVAYTEAALAKFLKQVPGIDAIQFRMHGESGLRRDEMHTFWENVYAVMNKHGKGIRFDARAKNFPDSLIDTAVEMGIDIRICTKYWMEQMGEPFHPTHVHPANQRDRRHGYADLLRYPQRYKMHWRLWNAGTTRVLLWADPQYVRRFGASTHLYNGEGFEVTEPLGTKMQDHPHDMKPFELLSPEHRYYRWEFERYWHFFQVFGRVGYNAQTDPQIWRHEFEHRFGNKAAPYVEQALHTASRILPRIVTYNYPYGMFPTTRGWVEKQRMKDLPQYADALPSDTEQFLSMKDAARCTMEGTDSAAIWPDESSEWFARISDKVLALADKAERAVGADRNKEFDSTMVDLRILAHLASYHSHRAKAGYHYALFKHSGDLNVFDEAIAHETNAMEAWEKLVASAGDFYTGNLMMGRPSAGLSGHWKDELAELREGLAKLRKQRDDFTPGEVKGPSITHVPLRKVRPNSDMQVRATVTSNKDIESVRLVYSSRDKEQTATMLPAGPMCYSGRIAPKDVKAGLHYYIRATDAGRATAKTPTVSVIVSNDDTPPAIAHTPVATARPLQPLRVAADVRDTSGVKWVRLRYRAVNQTQDYETLLMTPGDSTHVYECTVPGEKVDPQWDFMYFIEVMDNAGNGRIYPDLEKESPYVIVRLQR